MSTPTRDELVAAVAEYLYDNSACPRRMCHELAEGVLGTICVQASDHFVEFTDAAWFIEHSMECRLSGHMAECEIHRAVDSGVREGTFGSAFDLDGRFRVQALLTGIKLEPVE